MNGLSTRRLVRTGSCHFVLLITCTLLATSASGWARLPVPYECEGTITAIDSATHALTLMASPQPKLGRSIKPTKFVWTEHTEFIKNGGPTDASLLLVGERVHVHYQYPTKKQLPVLVKVVWGRMSLPPERGRSPPAAARFSS